MYKEHAGSRSDFIIVGHPEFQMGKVHSDTYGFPSAWDTRQRMHLRHSPARSRSTVALLGNLTATEQRPTLKARALERSMSQPEVAPRQAFCETLDAFIGKLSAPQASPASTTRPSSNQLTGKGWASVVRHFGELEEGLEKIRAQVKAQPDEARQELARTGAWRYYAVHMDQARRMKVQFKHDCANMEPALRAVESTRRVSS